jgi:hypothetical protein
LTVASLAVGDVVKKVSFTGGEWGGNPTVVLGSAMICRIDQFSAGENRERGTASESGSANAYFSYDPDVQTGDYLSWVTSGGYVMKNPTAYRVQGSYHEGRPGQPPMIWVVDLIEDRQQTLLIKSTPGAESL